MMPINKGGSCDKKYCIAVVDGKMYNKFDGAENFLYKIYIIL